MAQSLEIGAVWCERLNERLNKCATHAGAPIVLYGFVGSRVAAVTFPYKPVKSVMRKITAESLCALRGL